MATTYISISEGRKRIFEIAEAVQLPGVKYVLTEKGKPKVSIISTSYLSSLEETAGLINSQAMLVQDSSSDSYFAFDQILLEEGYEKITNKRSGKKRSN